MADTGARRVDRPDFHDNDPFAELTRIMGHDPRKVDDPSRDGGDEFGVDLEQELLGGLDLSQADAEAAQTEPPAQKDEPAVAAQDVGYEPPEAETAADVQTDNEAWSAIDRHGEELFSEQAFVDDFTDDLDAAISANLAGQVEEAAVEPDHAPPMVESDEGATGRYGDAAQPAGQDGWAVDASEPLPSMRDMPGAEMEPADDAQSLAYPHHHDWAEVEAGDGIAETERRSEAFEEDLPAATQPVETYVSTLDAAGSSQSETFAPHPQVEHEDVDAFADAAEVKPSEPAPVPANDYSSLENELSALLADEPRPAESHDAMSGVLPERHEVVPEADGEPDNWEVEQVAAPQGEQQAYDPFAALADLAAREEHQDTAMPSQAGRGSGTDFGVPEIETVDIDDARPPQFGDLHVPDLPREEPVTPAAELDDLEAELDRAFDFMNSRNHADVAVADTPADPGPDWREQEAPSDWTGSDDHPREDDNRWADTALYAAGATAYGTVASERMPDQADRYDVLDAEQHYATEDSAMASEVPLPPRPARAGSRRKGVVIAAAVVAVALIGGVSVFFMSPGGAGDGEPVLLRADAEPVRVRPEDPGGAVVPNQDSQVYERVAGGGEDSEPTQQQLVDTTEEPIDLDQQGAVATIPGLSDDEGGVEEVAAGETDDEPSIATVKAEDRVEPASESTASVSDDFVAVQPHRVRTMIVRPDGTMVPREETAAANTSDMQEAGTALAATSPGPSTAPSSGEDQMQLALAPVAPAEVSTPPEGQTQAGSAVELDAGAQEAQAVDSTPPVQGAPRSRPSDAALATEAAAAPTTDTQTQQDPPQQEQQVAAVDPAPAPAPTSPQSGEWSMQIASQPSAESAQVTYQDLARRYSSLLEGRGVNIVRAEIEGRGTYYRVRIPMDTRDEAISLCTRYKDAGGSCFVSR